MNIDDVFYQIGQFGPAQRKYYLASTLTVTAYAAFSVFNHQFTSWEPGFRCVNANGSQLKSSCFNGTVASCVDIVFDTDSNYSTMITEWNLVCDLAWKPPLAQSAFMLGLMGSSIISGPISDRFGRLRTLCGLTLLAIPTIAAQMLAPSINVYIVARFLNGLVNMGIVLSVFILGQELVGPDYRGLAGNLNGCAFAVGLMLLAPVARLCGSWRTLMAITTGLACLPPLLWFYVPESPRWLLVRGQRNQAVAVLRRIALGNAAAGGQAGAAAQLALKTGLLDELQPPRHDADSEGILKLLRTRRGAGWTLVQIVVWFTVNLCYYGLTAASSTVGGDRFVNFAISGLVDLPAHALIYVIIDRFGRRRSICGCFLLGALCCIAVPTLPSIGDEKFNTRSLGLWLGKLAMAAVFTMVYVHTLEIFPTSVRNRGISVVNASARISGLIYPFMTAMDSIRRDLQYMVFAVSMLISAGLVLLLPETTGRPLCATVDDLVGVDSRSRRLYSLLRTDDSTDSVELGSPLPDDDEFDKQS